MVSFNPSLGLFAAGAQAVSNSIPSAVFNTWALREKVEWEAREEFFRIGRWLKDHTPDSPHLSAFAMQCAEEESRHAELCRKLLALSPSPVSFLSPNLSDVMGPLSLSEKQRVLFAATAVSCITETLSTSLLIEMNRRAEPGPFKSVIREILEDEIGHSKIGWALLSYFGERESLSWLSAFVPGMLEGAYNLENSSPARRDLSEWGILDHKTVRELFYATTRDVIVPGLELFGVFLNNQWERGIRE